MPSNVANDNSGGVTDQTAKICRDTLDPVSELYAAIAGKQCTDIWRQGCPAFHCETCRILIYGLTYNRKSESVVEELASEIAKKLTAIQDNKVEKPPIEPRTFDQASENPQIKKIKSTNTVLGLLFSSFIRRWKRHGIDERSALSSLSQLYARPKSEIKLLIKYARNLRWKRIERIRMSLVPRWREAGCTTLEVAQRLNVTRQYAGRLINEIHWELEEDKC